MLIPFSLVDVFAERPLTGNPLAVVPQAEILDESEMRQISAEFNQAETTFVLPSRTDDADRRLRSFTAAGHEVFGAGHNSLGAWWWLAESGQLPFSDGPNKFIQKIGNDLLPLEINFAEGRPTSVVMTQSPPIFASVLNDSRELADSLGLGKNELSLRDLPIQVVSTGASHLLVPIRSRTSISKARPDPQRLANVLREIGGEGCYLYCLEAVSQAAVAHTRFFNPTMGIIEDSATGTAAGPLACQLVRHGLVEDGATIYIEQGYDMKRPSSLAVTVRGDVVRLAGRCVTSANGMLRLR